MAEKITFLFRNYKRYSAAAVLVLLMFILAVPQFAGATAAASTGIAAAVAASSANTPTTASQPTAKNSNCELWGNWSGCPAYAAAVTANFVLWAISLLLWLVSVMFSLSIGYSLSAEAFKANVIATGWAAARDVANLFFIFIMLAISIATILRRESYGAKTLLPRLIIVALLVNFSMPFTKAIIDVGNILAITFYEGTKAETLTTISINGASVAIKDVSAPLLKNLKISNIGFDKSSYKSQQATARPIDDDKPLMGIFMSGLLSSILILILAFILAAAGILFLLRAVILWILIILSPMAFLFMILPKTQGYATQWWEKLFQQTFFAPAFMFFFYLTLKTTAGVGKNLSYDPTGVFTNLLFGKVEDALSQSYEAITFFFSYAVIATFALASIVIAQKLGAVGASSTIALGKGAYKGALGYAGGMTKRYAGTLSGKAAEGIGGLGKEGTWGRTLAQIAAKPLAYGARIGEKERTAKKENLEKLSEGALKAQLAAALPGKQREALVKEQQRRENKKVAEAEREREALAKAAERKKREELAQPEEAKKQILAAVAKTQEKQDKARDFTDMAKLHIAMAAQDDKAIAESIGGLAELGSTVKDVVTSLKAAGQDVAARQLVSSPAKGAIDAALAIEIERRKVLAENAAKQAPAAGK